jgi:excisionase family DNA binding protein
MDEQLLTVKEVAGRLRCSIRTVHRLSSEGRLPRPHRVGRLARWRWSDIDSFISTNGKRS